MIDLTTKQKIIEAAQQIAQNMPLVNELFPHADSSIRLSLAKYWPCIKRLSEE